MTGVVLAALPLVLLGAALAVALQRRGKTEPWSAWSNLQRTVFLFGCVGLAGLFLAVNPDASNRGVTLAYALLPLLLIIAGLYVYMTGSSNKKSH